MECSVGEGVGTTIQLFGVNKGEKKCWQVLLITKMVIMVLVLSRNTKVLCVGDGRLYEYPLYLKAGDAVSLFMDKDTVYLTGKIILLRIRCCMSG